MPHQTQVNQTQDQKKQNYLLEHKSQMFFLILGIIAIPLTIRFVQEFGDMRAWMFKFKEPEQGWPLFSDFKITLVGAVISFIVSQVIERSTWNFFYKNCKEKTNEKIRLAKTHKAATSFYKIIYFTFATVWGYYVLRDEPYLPKWLLGKGDLSKLHDGYPTLKWPVGFREYYLGTMGYHLHQFFVHAVQPARNDFVEMMLHHIVTLFLYGFSYLSNITLGGAVIMFLHDWADVFTSCVRSSTECTHFPSQLFSAIMMALTWFYTRIIVLPMVICEACSPDLFHGENFFTLKFECFLLGILQILHVYWFYILILSFKKYIVSGQVVDMQRRIEESPSKKTN